MKLLEFHYFTYKNLCLSISSLLDFLKSVIMEHLKGSRKVIAVDPSSFISKQAVRHRGSVISSPVVSVNTSLEWLFLTNSMYS